MRADILLLGSCALIGYGHSFQIANFLSSFTGEQTQQRQLVAPYPDSPYPVQLEDRQDQIEERQSVAISSITTVAVVFIISLTVSIMTNFMFEIEAIFPPPPGL